MMMGQDSKADVGLGNEAGPETFCSACGTAASGAKFCPECGHPMPSDMTDDTQVLGGPQPRAQRPTTTARENAQPPRPEPPKPVKSGSLKFLVGVVLVLAVAAIGFGAAGFLQAQSTQSHASSLTSQMSRFGAQLKAANHQITALHASSAQAANAGNVSQLQASVGDLGTQLHKLTVCIPQLQQQLGSLTVQSSTSNGWLTNAYLSNPTIVSQDCSKTLYGSQR